jgi:undecaprenyl-diphosphatase
MSLWEIILLGVVQGVAEFLPISSSGHLVILEALLGHRGENLELNVALHFGTLLSILVVYRRDVIPALMQPRMIFAVTLATLPVVVTGLAMKDLFEAANENPLIAGCGLLVTSTLLFLTPRIDTGTRELSQIGWGQALVVGLFQAVAPFPGVSRSGSTIVGALLMGMRRDAAANFSFYIAAPALLGATILMLKDLVDEGPTQTPLGRILIGSGIAFVVGIVALKSLLRIVAARRLVWFAWYVLILGIGTIVASLSGWL